VLAGSLSGDSLLSTSSTRVRAVLNTPIPNAKTLNVHFRILGDSATVKPDSDGVTRKGVTVWANVLNACNLYFLACRTDSRQPSGTTVVEAQEQLNPAITGPISNAQLNSCAGQGYSFMAPPSFSKTDIMDGQWHDFTIRRTALIFRLYLDQNLMVEAVPMPNSLTDTGLYGLRTDNVNIELSVTIV